MTGAGSVLRALFEVGVADLRGGGLHVRVVRDRRVGGQRAVRCELLLGGVERGLRALHGVAGVRDFFLRHGAGLGDRHAAAQVVLSARQIGLAHCDLRLILVVVGEQAAHLAHRLAEIRFGLLQRDARIGRVQHDDRVARLDGLRVVGVDRDDRAGHLRRDLHDVAVDVRVVGRLVKARDEEVVQRRRRSRRSGSR